MPSVLQELVGAIISEVDDLESLKACSLVGPGFREPSQRILYYITLSGWLEDGSEPENYGAARILSTRGIPACRNLYNGRETAIIRASVGLRQPPVGPSTPSEPDALVDFMSRPKLHDLRVARITGLSLYFREGVSDAPLDVSPTIQDLVIHNSCDAIYKLLPNPSFNPYISKLRGLSFNPELNHSQIVVVPAAQTLERIHFVFNGYHICRAPIPLPPLPVLRTLEFYMLEYWLHSLPFILDTISSVLESNASLVLAEIVMTFPSWKCRLPAETDSMATRDEALVAHRAAPLMRWRTRSAQEKRILCKSVSPKHERWVES
ncbi:hypothetical protein K438DRAFT_1975105 [Mycena galopus ATCC 62051]|nr:hypothetical protein K438DRAFT_1975105 [Mycena galopus ATCC 62051]